MKPTTIRASRVPNLVPVAAAFVLGIAALAAPAGAHERGYASVPGFIFISCLDEQSGNLGLGGLVGGVLGAFGATADPLASDTQGTCYRANHVITNANGDVTFTWSDTFQTNVGGCVSQDTDGDADSCDIVGDVLKRGCNGVTVNLHFDDTNRVARANAWRFQDAQDIRALTTWIALNEFTSGSAALGTLIGALDDCGAGQDNFATNGVIRHG